MLNSRKTGEFIAAQRKKIGITQQQLADNLNISFQAVSKWENGSAYPNVELLLKLAKVLEISVDELLEGSERCDEALSYSKAGIDVAYTDTIKQEMAAYLNTQDSRVLNGVGPFASLYDIRFPEIESPVLVLKSEEPGSKQKLAMEYGYTESICHDMINHLVNDIIVMGARPLAVLDTIVCAKAERDTIKSLVKGISEACSANECSLVGGETSIQPQVIDSGVYILTSSVAGIVDKSRIIDGSDIQDGDCVLGIASNGLHTNGYSLVRVLMNKMPHIKLEKLDHENETFIEQIMKPHTPYYPVIKALLKTPVINGMAHITGGGIKGNLCRIIPDGLTAVIKLSKIKTLPLFRFIKERGSIDESEMLSTFNCGIGMIIVCPKKERDFIISQVSMQVDCYEIGSIISGAEKVKFEDHIKW